MIDNVPYLNIKKAHSPILPQLKEALEEVLDKGQLILGQELLDFEKNYAKFSGTRFCLGVANGYDAIILSLLSLGIGKGDEVIMPSNTYIATLFSATRIGATNVLVEPNPETYNIDPLRIEKAITKKTKAIVPVHLFGQISEMDKIMAIAKKHNLFVVEDNAQSHGSKYKGKVAGSFGHINSTSFYPGKNLGALGDGGAITTNNRDLYEKVMTLRNYGSKVKYYSEVVGYNSRLDELQAAFLSIKLRNLTKNNSIRQSLAKRYLTELKDVGDLVLPATSKGATHVYHVFAVRTKKRDKLQEFLNKKKIGTVIHYPVPPHLQKAYSYLGYKKGDFPIAEELAKTCLSIPIFPEMKTEEQEYVIKAIKEFYAG